MSRPVLPPYTQRQNQYPQYPQNPQESNGQSFVSNVHSNGQQYGNNNQPYGQPYGDNNQQYGQQYGQQYSQPYGQQYGTTGQQYGDNNQQLSQQQHYGTTGQSMGQGQYDANGQQYAQYEQNGQFQQAYDQQATVADQGQGYPQGYAQQNGYQQTYGQYAGQQPSYPNQPMYGQQQLPNAQAPPVQAPVQPPPRIDPKQIPRPVYPSQAVDIVKYFTRSGVCPPPSVAPFLVIDEGNCSPRFMRLTTNHIPANAELVDQTHISVGAVIQPLANIASEEDPICLVDFGPAGPLRCVACRCYVNPFFKFIDGGKFFICNMCDLKNEVPRDYQRPLDSNGFRRDKNDRPELSRGSVEYVATKEYITREINPNPVYLFVLDVSYSSVVTGLMRTVLQSINNCLDGLLSVQPNARVGIITFDSNLHFYRIVDKKGACVPQLITVADVNVPFIPLPFSQLIATLSNVEQRTSFEAALQLIEQIFSETRKEGTAFGAACQASAELLQGLGGKLIVVLSNLPDSGIGALKMRDNSAAYGTDKEKALLAPQLPFYETLTSLCADNAVSVDMFIGANSYIDLASIAPLASNTAGQLFFYPGFHARKDAETLQNDLFHLLTRVQGYDAIMTVRVSTGLRVAEFFGNYFRRFPLELEIPHLDCDKAFAVRFVHDGTLKDQTEVCIQCALLYTSATGERRIRVHTMSVPVTPTMGVIFRNADVDTILNISLKQVVSQFAASTIVNSRQALLNACINILHIYRRKCASVTSTGQLILPESLKVLPLFTLALLKGDLLKIGQNADERIFLSHFVNSMPNALCIPFVFPHLYALHCMPEDVGLCPITGQSLLPPILPLLSVELEENGIFLLDNGRSFYILIGEEVDPELVNEIFDIDSDGKSEHLLLKPFSIEQPESLSSRINTILDQIRRSRPTYCPVVISRKSQVSTAIQGVQRSDPSQLFLSLMFEDGLADKDKEAASASPERLSYVAFLCYLHRKIQDKFN